LLRDSEEGEMVRVACVLIVVMGLAGGTSWGAPEPGAPALYRLDPVVDTALLAGGAVLWLGAPLIVSPQQAYRGCDPCPPEEVNGLDRPFVRFHDGRWRLLGDLLFVVPGIAFVAGLAYTWTVRHPRSRYRVPVWIGFSLLAALMQVSRVASGDHFPTDVLVGGAVGTAFGLGWPALRHRLSGGPLAVTAAAQPGGGAVILVGGRL
jgi:hypothetical protein